MNAFICGYTAIDLDNISCLCKGKSEVCCFVSESCLDINEGSLGCGITTNKDNKECCKIAIPCYSFGVKWPERLCSGASQFLCIKSAQALPFHEDYVNECVCAYGGVQCAPVCSCCGPKGTECPALDRPLTVYKSSAPSRSDMIRDDDGDWGGGGYKDDKDTMDNNSFEMS